MLLENWVVVVEWIKLSVVALQIKNENCMVMFDLCCSKFRLLTKHCKITCQTVCAAETFDDCGHWLLPWHHCWEKVDWSSGGQPQPENEQVSFYSRDMRDWVLAYSTLVCIVNKHVLHVYRFPSFWFSATLQLKCYISHFFVKVVLKVCTAAQRTGNHGRTEDGLEWQVAFLNFTIFLNFNIHDKSL